MQEKYNIVLIGAGNIGSRHAQSLAASDKQVDLTVIDPFDASLELCRTRVEEVRKPGSKVSVQYLNGYDTIGAKTDLAIIATNSGQRLQAFQNLLSKTECGCVILEKFLFSTLPEYEAAQKLIAQHSAMKVYVNCVKRTFEAYHWLREILEKENGELHMTVSGKNWGLAGNSVHYTDLFSYLTNKKIIDCSFDVAASAITKSKRKGYIEINGRCTFESAAGGRLELISEEGDAGYVTLLLEKNGKEFTVTEAGSTIEIENAETGKKIFAYPFQSALTLIYFNQLASENKIGLPEYSEAAEQHKIFLHAIDKLIKSKKYSGEWSIT